MRILLAWIAISLLIGLLQRPIIVFIGSNLWVFHISTLLEYSFLVYIFSVWQRKDYIRKLMCRSIVGFFLIWILFKIWVEDFSSIDNYTSSIANAILAGISAYTMLGLVQENIERIFREPRFWVSSAVLIYYAGNIFTIALSNFIQTVTRAEATVMWGIHNMLAIVSNMFYIGGFLCRRKS